MATTTMTARRVEAMRTVVGTFGRNYDRIPRGTRVYCPEWTTTNGKHYKDPAAVLSPAAGQYGTVVGHVWWDEDEGAVCVSRLQIRWDDGVTRNHGMGTVTSLRIAD